MIDAHGVPRYWRHFLYGLRVMDVLDAREAIRLAGAASVPTMEKTDRDEWYRGQGRIAGW
jgi:hypothetical protein